MALNDILENPPQHGADYVIDQRWEDYTAEEHARWDQLYARQIESLAGRAVDDFYSGLAALDLGEGGIPDLAIINPKLMALTGWSIVPVPHLIPDDVFFTHLANRRFPAGQFIRRADQLNYIQEPDIFHDVFGHVPMLTLPVFADYMQAYGKGGLRAQRHDMLKELARLYWYTVEFGLIDTPKGQRIYGAGIVSSYTESRFSLESPSPHRIAFDLQRIMQTDYIIDDFQRIYFVIENFEQLLASTQVDFGPIYTALKQKERLHTVTDILPEDVVISHGDQSYKGRN